MPIVWGCIIFMCGSGFGFLTFALIHTLKENDDESNHKK